MLSSLMKTILLTGANGNTGQAVLRHIPPGSPFQLFLTYRREAEKESSQNFLFFDFDRLEESRASLEQTEILFLLRPPPISGVQGYFSPLLQACREAGKQQLNTLFSYRCKGQIPLLLFRMQKSKNVFSRVAFPTPSSGPAILCRT